jgi:plastocyanin
VNGRLIRSIVVLAMASPVAVALSPVAAAGGAVCHGAPVTDTSTDRVYMAENCFTPTIVRIDLGHSVTWTNKDGTAHGVTGANGAWGSYDEIRQGAQTTVRFTRSGIYPYFCFIHNGMIGAVVVGDAGASAGGGSGVITGASVAPSPGTAAHASRADVSVAQAERGWSVARTATILAGFVVLVVVAAVSIVLFVRVRTAARDPGAEQKGGLSLS